MNAWNALPASAFDFESVKSFKHFLNDCDLSQFLIIIIIIIIQHLYSAIGSYWDTEAPVKYF